MDSKKSPSTADIVLRAVKPHMELFCDEHSVPYARFEMNGRSYCVPVESAAVALFCQYRYYSDCGKSLPESVVRQVVSTLVMIAKTSECVRPVYRRIAWKDDSAYYSLGDRTGRAVRISSKGCAIGPVGDLDFFADSSVHEQVEPDLSSPADALLELLHTHFSIDDPNGYLLLAVYLVSCFIFPINHPVLVVYGEAGSSKTTTLKMLQALVEPTLTNPAVFPKSGKIWRLHCLNIAQYRSTT